MNEVSKKLQYIILEKNNVLDSPYAQLYYDVYQFWKTTWKGIFTQVGSPEAWIADDFFRQDLIPVIVYGDQIVAAHYYTFFDLRNPAAKDMRYFSIFPQDAQDWIFKNNFRKAMSMEFLTVHPNWRKSNLGFSAAEALISLGFNLMNENRANVAVGVAVKAAGVDEMAKKLSCSVLAKEVKRGNLVCDVMSQTVNNISPHPDTDVQKIISKLWNSRNYSRRLNESTIAA